MNMNMPKPIRSPVRELPAAVPWALGAAHLGLESPGGCKNSGSGVQDLSREGARAGGQAMRESTSKHWDWASGPSANKSERTVMTGSTSGTLNETAQQASALHPGLDPNPHQHDRGGPIPFRLFLPRHRG